MHTRRDSRFVACLGSTIGVIVMLQTSRGEEAPGAFLFGQEAKRQTEAFVVPRIASRNAKGPHIIVFGNEKGGVGKTTLAFHCSIALANAGHAVSAIDLDARQQSLARALRQREGTLRRLGVPFSLPRYSALEAPSIQSLDLEIARLACNAEYLIIDIAGADSPVARAAILAADTLVTPINDSFVDIGLLGHVDAVNGKVGKIGHFAELVQELRATRYASTRKRLDWVVVPNRLRRLGARNERLALDALGEIATKAEFRLATGLGDRVIFRELVRLGLTLCDLHLLPDMIRSHPIARKEIAAFIDALKLPQTASNERQQPAGLMDAARSSEA